MKLVIIILCIFVYVPFSGAQNFVAELYFEDSQGRKDTLTYGFNSFATEDIDLNLGEKDISIQSLDSFDVRAFRINTPLNHPPFVHGDCDHQDFELFMCQEFSGYDPGEFGLRFETKNTFESTPGCEAFQATVFNVEFFIPTNASYPITITWDSTLFRDSCMAKSHLSEIPPIFRADLGWCSDRIDYPVISFKDSSSVILQTPNFLTLARKDTTLVSVYYISLTTSAVEGPNSTIENISIPFKVFPNPNSGSFTLDGLDNYKTLSIFDIQGRLIKTYQEYTTRIEIATKGLHILKVEMGDGRIYSKKVTCY